MINIFYTSFCENLPPEQFEIYLKQISDSDKIRNLHFVRWQDQHSHLFGRLLLKKAIQYYNIKNFDKLTFTYNSNNKPIVENLPLNFNISHSGKFVLCAVSEKLQLGVDIEEMRPIEITDFKNVFTNNEWQKIQSSTNPIVTFYDFWTRKESVIKADGRGLSIPLDEFEVIENEVFLNNNHWWIHNVFLADNYNIHIASNLKCKQLKCIEFDF